MSKYLELVEVSEGVVVLRRSDQKDAPLVKIEFSDGHNTGIYTWDYLYEIGQKFKNFSNP